MGRTTIGLLFFGFILLASDPALAERINGKVSYIGTQAEYHPSGSGYQAVFRFRISESTCGNDATPKDRWFTCGPGAWTARTDLPGQRLKQMPVPAQ